MTHLLDTSALLAHYLGENGAQRVQELFESDVVTTGASILSFYEFELRLYDLGVDATTRVADLNRYRALLDETVDVTEVLRAEAIRLRTASTTHVAAMDVLIAAAASLNGATLVHRDPHFAALGVQQESLPAK